MESVVVYDPTHINVLLYDECPSTFILSTVETSKPIILIVYARSWNCLRVFGDIDENGSGGGLGGLQFSL